MKVEFESQTIEFKVKYSKRKTYEISIIPPDDVLVKVPKNTTEDEIKQIVVRKGNWIIKKLEVFNEININERSKKFIDGESFLYLGDNYPIEIINIKDNIAYTKFIKGKFYIFSSINDVSCLRASMEVWYRQKTLEIILQGIKHYQIHFNVKPNKIKVKQQNKRWGSCSSKGNLNFNWRLSMAPIEVIDYVVVHEMCHLVHMNHSKEFWNLVESILPDYIKHKTWLKYNGFLLEL